MSNLNLFLIMKKIFLFAATLMLAAAASAQSVTDAGTFPHQSTSVVPMDFASNYVTFLITVTPEGIAEVYDTNLEKVRSFAINPANAPGELKRLHYTDYWRNRFPKDQYFYFTQKLFNYDLKFEYIIGSTVYNEDGEVVLTLPSAKYDYYMVGLGTDDDSYPALYLIPDNNDGTDTYYRIDRTVSKVEYVRTMAAPGREVYDTEGRRLPAPQRGVNIIRESDGSTGKYLVK